MTNQQSTNATDLYEVAYWIWQNLAENIPFILKVADKADNDNAFWA